MDKTYLPQSIEQKWYEYWEKHHYFSPQGNGQPYCIMIPPPNVTGSLHMGHGFQHSIMDALIRYHRMLGDQTLWQMGTDHAGISTQMVVEKQLLAEKTSRQELGRVAFTERVWQWKEESGGNISRQLRRLGSSLDWSRERFTLDPGLSHAVYTVFIQLVEEGLIYRGKRLVNWDPKLETAISDLEVIPEEEQGHLWHIRYPLVDSQECIIVATTRPETMLGDAAVAVHPEDERYKHLIGRLIKLPLSDRTIPIIGDEYVDPTFASGCVKITPAHDFNDYAIGKRHHLPLINILTPKAALNENTPVAYQGLDRYQARKKIIEDLTTQGLLEKIENHTHMMPRGEKSGVVIEPYLTDQWFVKIAPLAAEAIKVVESGEIQFIPEGWNKTYFQWMNNIEDWCISRQLWWGHRIPAWYDEHGKIYVGHNEEEIRQKYKLDASVELKQDHDVLDTWFSSALWPFATLGWPEQTDYLKQFYPTDVLVTGFDIIFFWVARMIMMSLKFTKKIPFKTVYITGLIRDAEGQKMSKSKGNVLDPIDLIDGIDLESLIKKRCENLLQDSATDKIKKATQKEFPEGIKAYGTDALRFTYYALSQGRNIRFDVARLEGYANFCNKLWNAARYVMMNCEKSAPDYQAAVEYSPIDRWIRSRLQQFIAQVHQHFATFRFDLLANAVHDFIWHEYCDWYLELSKPILYSPESKQQEKQGTIQTLAHVLENLLRVLHPLMPFITEEIWQGIGPLANKSGDSIMLQPFPIVNEQELNLEIIDEIEWLKEIITAIRTIRSEMNVAPGKIISLYCRYSNTLEKQRIMRYESFLKSLAKIESIKLLMDDQQAPISATALVKQFELFVPLAGLIDKNAEMTRLDKEIEKINLNLQRIQAKLANSSFINNAPAEIVEKEKTLVKELQGALEGFEKQKIRLSAI